ncbi:telomerase protein component 1-like [Ylistrum balloti]|uniref:telomerase protein component 1-like n=1 Tax=Ylistrum balloti TaxID=509963 RepID=UPI002905D08E|nr:telomerase protein component 1-like [Ylistrum balloti]
MYKRYLYGDGPSPTQGPEESKPEKRQEQVGQSHEDIVRESVRKCWERAEVSCERVKELNVPTTQESGCNARNVSSWKTIRVFVSSTFTDFFNEREVLVKKVFPELREWCEERSLYLVECDLRWGVPKDSTTSDTISTCMEEIDRCHSENEGTPFFINLTGERYGWIPSKEEVPSEVRRQYDWINDTSITFMEVMHGAYRKRNPNAVFFFRNGDFCKDLPKEYQGRFTDLEPVKQEHLRVLKEKLRARFPDQVFPYSCQVEGVSEESGRQRVKLKGLEDFAEKAQDFLRKAIIHTYPDQKAVKNPDPEVQEFENHRLYMEKKSEFVVGREELLRVMMSYAKGDIMDGLQLSGGNEKSFVRDPTYWGLDKGDNPVLCLSGPVGYGKSTVMARLVQNALKSGILVIYHFVGCSADSRQTEKMYQRIVKAITGEKLDDMPPEEQDCMQFYKDKFRNSLPRLREEDRDVLVVIDAINELVDYNVYNHLSWLPPMLPRKIRCIVSTADTHFPTLHRLQEHPFYHMTMTPLTVDDARLIITQRLGRFNKTLASDEIDEVLSQECVHNPLWVWLITEELRMFGDFRTLSSKIKSVSESVSSLLSSIIKRLISDDETGSMEKVLCVIACSRGGVPINDLTNLLGDIEQKEALPALYWAKIRRHLKHYIRTVGTREYFTYSHSAIQKAVEDTLLTSRDDIKAYHKLLAEYYLTWSTDKYINMETVPYHYTQAGLKNRLVNFLRKSPDSRNMPDFVRAQYLQNLRCKNLADPVLPNTMSTVLCMACSIKKSAFAPQFYDNKSSCVVCGSHIFGSQIGKKLVLAHYCGFHSVGHSSRMGKCHVCKNVVGKDPDGTQKFGTVYGKLCNRCSFGNDAKKCCMILSD